MCTCPCPCILPCNRMWHNQIKPVLLLTNSVTKSNDQRGTARQTVNQHPLHHLQSIITTHSSVNQSARRPELLSQSLCQPISRQPSARQPIRARRVLSPLNSPPGLQGQTGVESRHNTPWVGNGDSQSDQYGNGDSQSD